MMIEYKKLNKNMFLINLLIFEEVVFSYNVGRGAILIFFFTKEAILNIAYIDQKKMLHGFIKDIN
jgi:hypothetical protein